MSVTVSKVFLRDGTTGKVVPAELYDSILAKHLDHHEQHPSFPLRYFEMTEAQAASFLKGG